MVEYISEIPGYWPSSGTAVLTNGSMYLSLRFINTSLCRAAFVLLPLCDTPVEEAISLSLKLRRYYQLL